MAKQSEDSLQHWGKHVAFPAVIALIAALGGAWWGAKISADATTKTSDRLLQYERESRSYEKRFQLYQDFNEISLLMLKGFLDNGKTDELSANRLNLTFSGITMIASDAVRQ